MTSFDEALQQATRRLVEAGIGEARVDARILLCEAAGIERAALLREGGASASPQTLARLDAFVARRLAREPVSRILGRREFWGLDLLVTPDVLDPRPDTETLVEAALAHAGPDRARPWRILDLGTGSGAIVCALLSEWAAARAWGTDRSLAACRVARENLARCGLAERGLILQGDWGESLAPGSIDLIVSNPPYIETAVIAELDGEVREHDPHEALDGGHDGLRAYRAIAAQALRLLAPDGVAFFEVGYDQAAAVSGILVSAGLVVGPSRRDLSGVERILSAMARG